ncbi:GTP cyclohydrolase II-domain-containing protein [Boletus edulis BED1]|uniref:GTP cyclohydrolase II n=1 Tax=Boletus edulis BED1 TaxID=1328754 RepID=A0AAD4C6X1_BOLED|nr:GTP cyclohydrolase II-domain-containing protein [Boletus edulis BED1]
MPFTYRTPNEPSVRTTRSTTQPPPYVSKQAPRRLRLQDQERVEEKENIPQSIGMPTEILLPSVSRKREPPLPSSTTASLPRETTSSESRIQVRCMARTRIPTPHGTVFLHLYHNTLDNKEHLAIVIDPAQYSTNSQSIAPPIRSRSLDAIWSDDETQEDRILRGAYVGRLTPETRIPSRPIDQSRPPTDVPPPLVRIHSECFTGETIGSMRCDCGEQLDEAIRLISQPIHLSTSSSATIPGRGAVIYLRQEGRGIGLLSKIQAYNLQDVGHDTVTANILLGHKADERGYDIAAAILRDLGLGSEQGESIRLLTNNPDKVMALEKEGLRVLERLPMVPRSWRCQSESALSSSAPEGRKAGVSMIGGDMAWGVDLNKYLRTKVLRMGHILPLSMIDEMQ